MDVHKESVAACVIAPGLKGSMEKEIRTFGTMTRDLIEMSDWLAAKGVTHVAMESTGVYWKPIYNLLEDAFVVILANARHIKTVPGRKTDVSDCEWIADLLRHGLLSASFIPPIEIRELREWTRLRKQLVGERVSEVNRVQKILETMNIKLSSVATDVFGVSGRAMLEALARGETNPAVLSDLAKGRLKKKHAELERALEGRMTPNGRALLSLQMRHIDELDRLIDECEAKIEGLMSPFEEAARRLMTIPGVSETTAPAIVAEIGADMSRFPSDAHLASWAGMCPGNNESAGKRHSGKTPHGNVWLRAVLSQAAWAASHTKENYLSSMYRRLARRRGKKRAIIAVGHAILIISYHVLKNQTTYQDLGPDFFELRKPEELAKILAKRIQALGFEVTLQKRAA
jgi:transposase